MGRLHLWHLPRQGTALAVVCLLAGLVLLFEVYVSCGGLLAAARLKLGQTTIVLSESVPAPPAKPDWVHSGPFRFPKHIHQTVKDKTKLSCQHRKVIASWRELNPGYSHYLWDDTDIQRFIEQYYPELVPTPFNDFVSGVERSDLWRVLVLHQLGGVYADMDVQCLKPIDEWNADHGHDAAVLLGIENYDEARQHPLHVVNWVLAAVPGHPLLGSMPSIVVRAIQREFFKLARSAGAMLHGPAYTAGIIDRTGPAALSWAVYEYLSNTAGINMRAVKYSNVTSPAGLLAGGVRLLPVERMASGWEVAEARGQGRNFSCNDLVMQKPHALVCHMFWGSWRDSWGLRQQYTYGEEAKC